MAQASYRGQFECPKQKAASTCQLEKLSFFLQIASHPWGSGLSASLSIGATRIFRVKRAAGGPDEADAEHAASNVYDIPEQDTPEVSQVAEPHEISPCLY